MELDYYHQILNVQGAYPIKLFLKKTQRLLRSYGQKKRFAVKFYCKSVHLLCEKCSGPMNDVTDDSRPATIDGSNSVSKKDEKNQVGSESAEPGVHSSVDPLNGSLTHSILETSQESNCISEPMDHGYPDVIRT